jgi:hypothetical protein
MPNNGAELAIKLQSASRSLGKANRDAVSKAALVYKDAVLAELRSDAGGDQVMSHWGWKSSGNYRVVKMGAGYDLDGTDKCVATLKARPMGLWKVMEYGASRHEILPRKNKRKKGGRLKFANGGFGRGVMHPGTRPKRTWSKGIQKGSKPAMAVFSREHKSSLAKSFGVGS